MEQEERIESARIASKMTLEGQKSASQLQLEDKKIAEKVRSQLEKEETQKEIEGFRAGFNLVRDMLDE
jgi:hypothetical protein